MTRWPERETASDWSQGVPLDKMQALVSYWARSYDWRAAEARDEILDNITQKLDIPVAVSVFPGELYRPLKLWGERVYSNLIYWNEVARGGHFAALEQPDLFVAELRASLAALRGEVLTPSRHHINPSDLARGLAWLGSALLSSVLCDVGRRPNVAAATHPPPNFCCKTIE